MSEVKALARNLRVSPRKLGVVAALVRGRSVKDSLTILEHTPRQAAPLLAKVVKSAAANAENNQKLPRDGLEITTITVTPGFVRKTYRFTGRYHFRPQRHRTSHVTVVVKAPTPAKAEPIKPAAAKSKTTRKTDGSKN